MAVKIVEHLTTLNLNVANRTKADIQYIVIHFVGAALGALANCRYFANTKVGSSAHLFVGHEGEVYRSVSDKDIAWHCGAQTYYSNTRNTNSIGIELCCRQTPAGTWYFEKATVDAAVELTKEYMAKYDIPVTHVVRHYDVTRKMCPEPFCGGSANEAAWSNFKARLTAASAPSASAPSAASYGVRVTAASLNIRTGPGTQYAVCGSIQDKGLYSIVAEADGPGAKKWGKLSNGAGWIGLDHATVVPNAPAGVAAPPPPPPPPSSSYVVRVTAASLNIRTGPGTQYAVCGSIQDKGLYSIVAEADGPGAKKWGKLHNGAGWIGLDYTTAV